MGLKVTKIPAGMIETNAYLVMDSDTREAILVDAPNDAVDLVQREVDRQQAEIKALVITHGHWDHITGAADVLDRWDVPVLAHPLVRERLEDPAASPTSPVRMKPVSLTTELNEGDSVQVGGYTFGVMHMPGHDMGHITLYDEGEAIMLGGDVLFPGGHGRTDIPGSDQLVMNETLKRFLGLPPETTVYTGHGDTTTVAAESPWIRSIP